MLKIEILLMLIALVFAPLAEHQKGDANERRAWLQIEDVSLTPGAADGSSAPQLRVRAEPVQDCAAPLQSEVRIFPHNIDIQVYHDIPAAASCEEEQEPFSLDLSLEPGAEWNYVIVNDQVWARERSDEARHYHELSLAPIFVDSATLSELEARPGERALRFRGSQAIGCDLPLLYAWRESKDGLMIGIYNAIDPEIVCPAVLVEIDETIEFDATERSLNTLRSVNAFVIDEMETETVSNSDKVLTNIMRVDVHVDASRPARVSLDVEGEHPDGCDFPVLVDQARAGNRYQRGDLPGGARRCHVPDDPPSLQGQNPTGGSLRKRQLQYQRECTQPTTRYLEEKSHDRALTRDIRAALRHLASGGRGARWVYRVNGLQRRHGTDPRPAPLEPRAGHQSR